MILATRFRFLSIPYGNFFNKIPFVLKQRKRNFILSDRLYTCSGVIYLYLLVQKLIPHFHLSTPQALCHPSSALKCCKIPSKLFACTVRPTIILRQNLKLIWKRKEPIPNLSRFANGRAEGRWEVGFWKGNDLSWKRKKRRMQNQGMRRNWFLRAFEKKTEK